MSQKPRGASIIAASAVKQLAEVENSDLFLQQTRIEPRPEAGRIAHAIDGRLEEYRMVRVALSPPLDESDLRHEGVVHLEAGARDLRSDQVPDEEDGGDEEG